MLRNAMIYQMTHKNYVYYFRPLQIISHWLKDQQSNHINLFCLEYVTHWTSIPHVPMSSEAVTAASFLLNLFWNNLQISSCSCQEIARLWWHREFQKLKIQESACDLTWVLWGGLGSSFITFPNRFSWMSLMMTVVCLGWSWWSEI